MYPISTRSVKFSPERTVSPFGESKADSEIRFDKRNRVDAYLSDKISTIVIIREWLMGEQECIHWYGMEDEWECIDMKCTYWDGERCTLGFCEPDTYEPGSGKPLDTIIDILRAPYNGEDFASLPIIPER